MKRALQAVALAGAASALVLGSAVTASAASPPATGQPNQNCDNFATGGVLPVPGFNTAGFAHAADVYAGSPNTPSALHSRSGVAVSQYDVACSHVGQH